MSEWIDPMKLSKFKRRNLCNLSLKENTKKPGIYITLLSYKFANVKQIYDTKLTYHIIEIYTMETLIYKLFARKFLLLRN